MWFSAGALPEFAITVPLVRSPGGVVHVRGTRVTLDTLVGAFDRASEPEEIARAYPTVDVAAVYAAIAYVLQNREEVDAYLAARSNDAGRARAHDEEVLPPRGIRARHLQRRARWPLSASLAIDENFNHDVASGLTRRLPSLDLRRVAEVDVRGASDAEVLAWAATGGRILVTHDAEAMGRITRGWAERGEPAPGVFEVALGVPVAEAVEDLVLLVESSTEREWDGQVLHLPLR